MNPSSVSPVQPANPTGKPLDFSATAVSNVTGAGAHQGDANQASALDEIEALQQRILELTRKREEKEQEALIQKRRERHEKIMKLPAEFGLADGDLNGVIAIIRAEIRGTDTAAISKGRRYATPDREKLYAAIKAKTPAADVMKHFGISQSYYYIIKSKLGLTKKYSPRGTRAPKKSGRRANAA